jgi:hypothetical protein
MDPIKSTIEVATTIEHATIPAELIDQNVIQHAGVLDELNLLYATKNHDYGDSFHRSFLEEGMAMLRIRLGDKFSRFKTLSRGSTQYVTDEGIRDTLMDMANYALMGVMELDRIRAQVPTGNTTTTHESTHEAGV